MTTMPLRRLFATALVCMLSSSREAAADVCSAMTVTGGASPGTYLITDDILEDRNVYAMTEDGAVVAIFRFYEGSVARRLEEAFEGFEFDPSFRIAGRSLEECATGFWANFEGDGTSSTSTADNLYPFFVAADCADDPSEISAEWLSVACTSCEQVPDDVTITCTETSDSVDGTDAEDSATSLGAGAGMFLAALTTAFVAHSGAFFLW